nr:hypothetical protein Q903MT_gene2597 [Picea sitchensis]
MSGLIHAGGLPTLLHYHMATSGTSFHSEITCFFYDAPIY